MEKKKRYVGTTEDRINKWMRMLLQWQFDIRRGIERRPNHYFTKYHVGKYPKSYFSDLPTSVVDRGYVIRKMNEVSEKRMKRDRQLGIPSNRVKIRQTEMPNRKVGYVSKGVKISEDTILKEVCKYSKTLFD